MGDSGKVLVIVIMDTYPVGAVRLKVEGMCRAAATGKQRMVPTVTPCRCRVGYRPPAIGFPQSESVPPIGRFALR